jgi:hypothetical protein
MPARPITSAAATRIADDEVVVHIRGGDFLRLAEFQVVDADFYVRAARQAMERGFSHFAILSDDSTYAMSICNVMRKHLPIANIRLIPRGANALEDFDTLRAAAARIIGNSTFSWWATVFGASPSPTWTPRRLTIYKQRTFFLHNEIPLDEHS